MKNIPNTFNYNEVIDKKTLNTFIFETGLNSGESLDIICPKKINGSDLDKKGYFESEFSIDNRIDAWGENYKENNVIYTQRLNGTKDQINLPSIWGGGMGMDVSSLSLLEAASIRNFSGTGFSVTSHLSSIGMGAFRGDDLFENNGEGFDKYELQITKDFYKLFFLELGLTRKQIVSHFLRCDENLKLDASFQPINKYGKLFLMKDLIALYNDIKSAKEKGLFVPVNHMYKSTGYVASIKVAALAGADAITTGAGIPKDENNNLVRPKDIISDFFKDIGKTNIRISAFGLIVSMTSPYAPGYDYYIDEDPRNAGGHQGATEGMLKFKKRVGKESVLKSLRKREGIDDNTPIYAGGGIGSSHEIKDMFNMGFNGVQLGTNFAVSEEARNCEGEDFKKALISGNHYGKETEIDEIAKNAIKKLEENIKKEIEIFRKKFEDILQIKKIEKKCEKDLLSLNLDGVSFEAVINNIEIEIFGTNSNKSKKLNEDEEIIYKMISEELFTKYEGNIENLRKDLRFYGNLLKGLNEFIKFANLGKIPTHLLFDSVVGFIGRLRIEGGEHRLLNETVMNSVKCVQCVTHCILRNTGVSENKGSKFCISDSLRIGDIDREKSLVLNFSGKTTCFYPEIRPIKDIILAYMGTEVIR